MHYIKITTYDLDTLEHAMRHAALSVENHSTPPVTSTFGSFFFSKSSHLTHTNNSLQIYIY